MTGWIYVDLTYACFRLEVSAGRVRWAAPIAHWARGKSPAEVRAYYRRRGCLLRWIDFPD